MDVPFSVIPAFLLTCVLIEATPGPNMTYLALLSLSRGRRAGMAATAGVALGLLIMGMAVVWGAGPFIMGSPSIYGTLQGAGFLYLLWLAWDAWKIPARAQGRNITPDDYDRVFFLRGLITNILNPKAAIFYVAILPGYAGNTGHPAQTLLVMSLIYVVVATIVHILIVAMASAYTVHENTLANVKTRAFFAASLILTAFWFLYSTNR